jgi:glycerophosphoryl diester phosphodiesterase
MTRSKTNSYDPHQPLMAIAHRGASSYAPENTLAAFDLALRMGALHIEFDVQSTADGHIVVIHDDSVDRTTDDEVLQRYRGRAHLHVELKGRSSDLTQRTVDLIREHGMTGHVTITSFQKTRLEETREYAPELPTGWLVREVTDATVADASALGLTQLCPRADLVTADLVRRLHVEGFVVRAWGVGTEELMQRVVDAGADGMTVNFPDRLIAFLGKRPQP